MSESYVTLLWVLHCSVIILGQCHLECHWGWGSKTDHIENPCVMHCPSLCIRHNISFANMHANNKRAESLRLKRYIPPVTKSDFDKRTSLRLFILGDRGLEREMGDVQKRI